MPVPVAPTTFFIGGLFTSTSPARRTGTGTAAARGFSTMGSLCEGAATCRRRRAPPETSTGTGARGVSHGGVARFGAAAGAAAPSLRSCGTAMCTGTGALAGRGAAMSACCWLLLPRETSTGTGPRAEVTVAAGCGCCLGATKPPRAGILPPTLIGTDDQVPPTSLGIALNPSREAGVGAHLPLLAGGSVVPTPAAALLRDLSASTTAALPVKAAANWSAGACLDALVGRAGVAPAP